MKYAEVIAVLESERSTRMDISDYTCMYALKKGRRLENKKKFFELKSRGYRDGVKRRDKIGMGYESLHIMELLSVQCLQIDDVIPIFSPCRKP